MDMVKKFNTGEVMVRVKKSLVIVFAAFLTAQLSWAETLTDIYENALQNDPVLRAARANFQVGP